MSVIKSISYSQTEILRSIMTLQGIDRFDLDATYGRGRFWDNLKEPRLKFDLAPTAPNVVKADCRQLPVVDRSIRSVVFDPPFLATKGPSLKPTTKPRPRSIRHLDSNLMAKRFGTYPTEKLLHDMYRDSIQEFCRVLRSKGHLIFKCQDKVSSGKQYCTHCHIWKWAEEIGFYTRDLYVLLAKSRMTPEWQVRGQKHARKFHSYFWVFEKR